MKRFCAYLSLLGAVAVLLVSCQSQQQNVIRIGAAGPMTGDQSKMGMDLKNAVELANRIAPEHLELMVSMPRNVLKGITAAGAVFLGNYSPVAVGDYVAGPSHVLPTAGTARFFSPLGINDFLRRMSVIAFSKDEFMGLVPWSLRLARLEGLDAHARALEKRSAQ